MTSKSSFFRQDYQTPTGSYVKSQPFSFYLVKTEWKSHFAFKTFEHFCENIPDFLWLTQKNAGVSKTMGIVSKSCYVVLYLAKFHHYGIWLWRTDFKGSRCQYDPSRWKRVWQRLGKIGLCQIKNNVIFPRVFETTMI